MIDSFPFDFVEFFAFPRMDLVKTMKAAASHGVTFATATFYSPSTRCRTAPVALLQSRILFDVMVIGHLHDRKPVFSKNSGFHYAGIVYGS